MTPARKTEAASIHQLKVTLKRIKPPIWRRIQVRSDITLHELHQILQFAMGWLHLHLHEFVIDGVQYGDPNPYFGLDLEDDKRIKVSRAAPGPGDRFVYEYDFGDGWHHAILVEKILPAEEGVPYPICLKGSRACPPEDCGGPWGYSNLLRSIRDPSDEEQESPWRRHSGRYDPEAFDVDVVNERLEYIRQGRTYLDM